MSKKNKPTSELSKKERKALKAREEQLDAELAERKAAKKAKKSAKHQLVDQMPVDDADDTDDPDVIEDDATEQGVASEDPEADETDAAIKARVTAKRGARAAMESLDRGDDDAVRAFNETHGKVLGEYATSTRESEEQSAKMDRHEQMTLQPKAYRVRLNEDEVETGDRLREAVLGPMVDKMNERWASQIEEVDTERGRVFVTTDAGGHVDVALDIATAAQTIEEVNTERGRVFVTSDMSDQEAADVRQHNDEQVAASEQPTAADLRGFALPSEGKGDFETNGLGQYKVKRPSDGKLVGYSRVTTVIDCIDDKSALVDWKMRTLLEGLVANEDEVAAGGDVLHASTIRDLIHRRDTAIAKGRKKDRKGKLDAGELATIEEDANREFKKGANVVIEALLELGKVHAKAAKGTELHDLSQLYFETGGLDAVGDLLTAGTITPSDMGDIEALDRAVRASGFKWIVSEQMVVNDEAKIAGRLDGIAMVRLPGSKRATRLVFDIKTGRIDMGTKIPMQLANYAGMKGYDPAAPDEREDLKINPTKALLVHLPAGKGECHMYVVDLPTGRVGNKIAMDVRQFRNTGKRGIDTTVDLATGVALESPEEE